MNFRSPYARLIAFAAIFILVITLLAAAAFAATPAFSVHKNGTAQTVVGNTATKLTWSHEAFDTNTNFANDRFTPTIAGTYLIVVSVQCAQPGACIPAIYKNGALYAASRITNQTFADQSPQATALVSMNGSTDYVEAFATSAGTSIAGLATQTYFSGSQIDGTGTGTSQWVDGTGGTIYYNDGNVGIGTTSPSNLLHVDLGSAGTGSFMLSDVTAPGSGLSLGEGGSAANTFTPLIRGFPIGSATVFTGLYSEIAAANDTGTTPAMVFTARQTPPAALASRPPFQWRNSGTNLMTIDASGNVGIGIASPAANLHVHDADNYSELKIQASAADSYAILSLKNDARDWRWQVQGTDADKLYLYDATALFIRMVVDSSGNVGIGTTNPLAKFVVSGGSSLPEVRISAATNDSTIRFLNSGLNTGYAIGMERPGDSEGTSLVFSSFAAGSYTKRVYFDSAGNADVDGSVTAAGYVQRCPAGFTVIGNASRSLGCMQTTENAASNWTAANDACFDDHGGRLPFSSEWHIAMANFALTGETGNWEWLADAVGDSSPYDNHAVAGSTAITDFSWGADSGNYTYRCFLPK